MDDLRAFIEATLHEWKVPGAAVGIVKEGEVIVCDGFGQRDVAQNEPVTAETVFPIGSCTKAFTAMSVGLLVDEGKLDWDRPVKDYLPAFRLYDSFATDRMTPRDLLTHRSGLPRHDLMWYASRFNRRQLFDRLRYLEPTRDLRVAFQYQNIMYAVAGLLVSEVTGMTWEEFVQTRIFNTLDMGRSNLSTAQTLQMSNIAQPYLERQDEIKAIPYYQVGENDAIGPAGSINSCVADMVKWLKVHVNHGKVGEGQFISEASLVQMHSPQMVMGDFGGLGRVGLKLGLYGMGWMIHSFQGRTLVHHGGNINGFSALTSLLPEENVGVVVLTNLNATFTTFILSFALYERLLGLTLTDWSAQFRPLYTEIKAAQQKSKDKLASDRRTDTQPSHPLAAYLGDYEHPGYGVISIQPVDHGLQMVLNDKFTFPLEHYHYDYFEAYFEEFDEKFNLSFLTDLKGNIVQLVTQMQPGVKPIVFDRMPDKRLKDHTFLAQFEGLYDLLGSILLVALKGDTLTATIQGQREYSLIPYQGAEFQLKDMPGFSLEFKRDDTGRVVEAVLVQPGAVFSAQRRSGD
ncbi:MAG: serine hydrolase [Anaerolineae bacterium]|nr:serine hydrolase [Anaerolineae bacterium]